MANSAFFKQARTAFDELSVDGYIGDPQGILAYAYIRVSSEEQATDNRSGLARQVAHCHDIAKEKGYRIPWDMVFADDDSGFVFENRHSLTQLRDEIRSSGRRANVVVMEILDRLSRNADWHQGYLLDEMKRHGVEAVFWKAFNSRIERAVMGAIAQDAMELSLARMYEGQRAKARKGQVTSRTRAYGYKFVDSQGREGSTARKDTHYAIFEPEAEIIRRIYTEVASAKPLRQIARDLTGIYPTPKGKVQWGKSTINALVNSPNYKGEFHAFRWSKDREGHNIEYDDYIIVPIPAIVSVELWNAANDMLEKNRQMSYRSAKKPYLLTGLIKCANCGLSYVGHSGQTRKGRKGTEVRKNPLQVYWCSSRGDHRHKEILCPQGKIGCRKLDTAVWSVICMVLLNPEILTDALERQFEESGNATLLEQIAFIEGQITAKQTEDERLFKAYMAGAFDEDEYADQRRFLKDKKQTLQAEAERLRSRVMTREQIEAQTQFILETAEQLKHSGNFEDAPFELKQQIIKLVVSKIILNTDEGWFRLEGAVSGQYSFAEIPPDDTPDGDGNGMAAHKPPSGNLSRGKLSAITTKNAPTPDRVVGFVAEVDQTSDKPL